MSEGNKEVTERQNSFCVIKIESNENGWHDVQCNSSWKANPYGEEFVEVEDELVPSILETGGYCDITLDEEGTKCVAFVPTEKPVVPEEDEEEPEPSTDNVTWESMAEAINEGVNEV